ncbi:hydroxypyruvate isomerase [Clostridium sp. SY8519]|uniref:TIM barrel protein n=1 Tax=Clostridium sp. (strain SY8519) TaxID=1042156 RepID=UPI0002171B59|nr:TIM barrel protein [Clostridium sp. SY8519]BAK47565.1 hydroxypyruvate isomerase [Clostridium sp. SY8519]
MKYSCMVDIFFGQWGVPMSTETYLESLETLKEAGYDGFEILSWWDDDLDAIKAKADELGLEVASIMCKCDCMGAPELKETYLNDLKASIEAAKKLGCKQVFNSLGHERMFLSRQEFFANTIDTLKEADKLLEGTGVELLIEPVNVDVDHAGVFPLNSHDAFFLIRALGDTPNIKILFDLYHQQITDGNLLETITRNINRIGHFHAAGSKGRNELEYSELNYAFLREEIEKLGFDGYLGMEYDPTMDKLESLIRSKNVVNGIANN